MTNGPHFAIMRREVIALWRDRQLRYILLVGSLLSLFLFLTIYSTQVIKDIPTAVVDLDNSSASRELAEQIGNTENLKVVVNPESYRDLEKMIQEGQVITGIVIPEHYGKDVALGRQTRLQVIIDGSNMIYATNASSAVLTIARSIGAEAGIKSLISHGVQYSEAQDAYQTIEFSQEPWFNPSLNYAYFLVLALALNFWQQCCTLAACGTIAGEVSRTSWLQIRAAGFSRLRLFTCKAVVQVGIFLLVVLPVYLLAFTVFKIPLQCSFGVLMLFTVFFAIALHGISTLVSSFARTPLDATRFGMIIALPSFVFSGYTWPIEQMGHWLQPIVYILPQTWFFQGFNYLTFKNPGWDFMATYFLALLGIAGICYGAAALIVSLSKYRVRRVDA